MIFIFSENSHKTELFNKQFNIKGTHLYDANQLTKDCIIYKYGFWMDNPQKYNVYEKMLKLNLNFSKLDYTKSNKYFLGEI